MLDPQLPTVQLFDPTAEPLIPRRCGDCGYDLRGLPERGVCPECGVAYSPEQIILFGWGAGASLTATNARGGQAVWATLGGTFWLVYQAVRWGLRGYVMVSAGIGGLVGLMLIARLVSRRRAMEDGGGTPAQLRLTPAGYGVRDGVGPVALKPWAGDLEFVVGELKPGRYRMIIRRKGKARRSFRLSRGDVEQAGFEWEGTAQGREVIRAAVNEWIRRST